MKNILFIFTVILFTLSSCQRRQHKYPEDTEKTKLTPKERIINKWWVLDSVTLNGVNYMDTVYNKIGKLRMYLGEDKYEIPYLRGVAETDYESSFGIIWTIWNSDTQAGIYRQQGIISPDLPVLFYINYDSQIYTGQASTILKLSSSEFKISIKSNSGDTTIINKFKAQ